MTKLEKSIRREMKHYGPAIRNGHYGVVGYAPGLVPNDFRMLKSVCCDVENGEVVSIRIYGVGDAMEARDYHGESIDITAPVEHYISLEHDWDLMISNISQVIVEELA